MKSRMHVCSSRVSDNVRIKGWMEDRTRHWSMVPAKHVLSNAVVSYGSVGDSPALEWQLRTI